MTDSAASEQRARVSAAAGNLRVDAATAEVLRGLDAANTQALLLKGPALSAWYSDEPYRTYHDCDLWVAPEDVELTGSILAAIGFRRKVDDSRLPRWWREHATTWVREADDVAVDLHRNLQGINAEPQAAWDILSADTETVVVGGYPARILSLPARALYVTLHAADHGREWGKALDHVERALAAVDEDAWRAAAGLAERLDAVDAFATGLRLVPAGAVLADELDLPATESVRVALRATSPPPVAMGFEQLASAASWRERIGVVVRKVVPPAEFVRHWWPPAARNWRMLALGYLYRPVWLLRNAPRGLRAWRAARRQVAAGRDR